jgi:hypothetical protein
MTSGRRTSGPADASRFAAVVIAGGRKKIYPGRCGAFPQGTPVHFEVQGWPHLDGRSSPPRLDWACWLFSDPVLPAGRTPLPPGSAGPRLWSCAAPQRGDRAHERLKGDRRRLGYVVHCLGAAHSGASAHEGSACDLGGSDERIDMEWHHRVWRGTALELVEQSRRLVRVTTANGCFMASRPTDTASGLLVIEGSCGRHTRLGAKLTPSRRGLSSTMR